MHARIRHKNDQNSVYGKNDRVGLTQQSSLETCRVPLFLLDPSQAMWTQPVGAGEAAVSLQRLVDADAVDEAVDDAVGRRRGCRGPVDPGRSLRSTVEGLQAPRVDRPSIGRRRVEDVTERTEKRGLVHGRRSVRLRLIVTQRWSKEGKRP